MQEKNKNREDVGNVEKGEDIISNMPEEIAQKATTHFGVSNCPISTFKKFKALAQQEFRDDYALTIKALLDYYIEDLKFTLLADRIARIEEKLMLNEVQEKKKVIKTLGGVKNVKTQ